MKLVPIRDISRLSGLEHVDRAVVVSRQVV